MLTEHKISQSSNMLVLAGTYNSRHTRLLDRVDLPKLFERTIDFLKFNEDSSPVLKRDTEILEHVRDELFFVLNTGSSLASSYPSF